MNRIGIPAHPVVYGLLASLGAPICVAIVATVVWAFSAALAEGVSAEVLPHIFGAATFVSIPVVALFVTVIGIPAYFIARRAVSKWERLLVLFGAITGATIALFGWPSPWVVVLFTMYGGLAAWFFCCGVRIGEGSYVDVPRL